MSNQQEIDKSAQTEAINRVRDLYDGAQAELFALVFGEQIHLGGLRCG